MQTTKAKQNIAHDADYLIGHIPIIAAEYHFIMGKTLDDRIVQFLTAHGVAILVNRPFREILSNVPSALLNDLSEKMQQAFTSPEVAARLRTSSPNYSRRPVVKDFLDLLDDCEDF